MPHFIWVRSSFFCSVGRDVYAGHLGGHDVSSPAAQGQQEDHEGKDQMAHMSMIVLCWKSSIGVLFNPCVSTRYGPV